ncbi:hypothetical protein AB0Y21_07395 [Weissella paramesenteroides]|uniref:hypothetical protein n=1 Tax=Weissella paramesenteroides TaxID=1249 RepID=UPI003F24D1AB
MKTQTFNDLIEQINQAAGDVQHERGTIFEKLVLAYLKHEPTYKALYPSRGLKGRLNHVQSNQSEIVGNESFD